MADLAYLHGAISRQEAETLLRGSGQPGSYLLRSRDAANKSFAYSCLGNESKIIHSKVDYTAAGVSIDNKHEPSLAVGAPLDQIVNFLNTTRKNLGLVVGVPLPRTAGSAPSDASYNVGGDAGGGGAAAPAAAPTAPKPTHPVAFNKNAILLRQEPSTNFLGKILKWKKWNERWGELRNGNFTIYESRSTQKELEQVKMSQVTAADEADVALMKRNFCFTIVKRSGQEYFQCNNSKDREAWLTALKGAMNASGSGANDEGITN